MNDLKWSDKEKSVARRAFEAALTAELAEIIANLKDRVAAVTAPDEVWAIEEHLRLKRMEIDRKYDFRYSQLIFVFGQLVREGRIREDELSGLSEEKIERIRRLVS